MPKVSVIIPCYNHGMFLTETLDSLAAQTYSNFEVIIVNDGSTDAATVDILLRLKSRQVKVINSANKGVSAARNRGISEAVGDYILPLDADDKIGPEYLALAVEVLDASPEVAVVYFERVLFGDRDGLAPLPDYDPRALLFDNCVYAGVFRKADWKTVGGFCSKFVYGWEDWDFWISLSSLGKKFVKIPRPLFFYRIRNNSRDHSLRIHQKIAMMSLIIVRHRCLYLRSMYLILATIKTAFFRNFREE